MMSPAKLAALFLCCILLVADAAEPEKKTVEPKAEAAVATTKLTPSVEEPKSKTEKRDSSDQTGTVFVSKPAKEAPFRASYAAPASAAAAASYREVAESDSVFEPTTVRYSSVPQNYYIKPTSSNIRYGPTSGGGGGHRVLPGPVQLSQHHQHLHQQHHHQPQQQQQQLQSQPHRFSFAVPQQLELYQRTLGKSPQQHSSIYSYAEPEPGLYERAGPVQYQLAATVAPQHQEQLQQQHHQPLPQQQFPLPGHRIQYIIAIPLSYMRQLQQQLGSGTLLAVPPSTAASTTSTTSTTTSAAPATAASQVAAASHPVMQLLGPLARDHHGIYRPYYSSDAAASASHAGPTPATAHGPQQQQQYLQIPASVLLAAAQQLQQHHQQQQQQQQQHQLQALYPKVGPTPATLYQPVIYQTQSPPPQLPRIYQQPQFIYTEQPVGGQQQTALYAYPIRQQQQHPQLQLQQQQPHRLIRLGTKQTQQQQLQQQHKYPVSPSAAPTAATVTSAAAAAAAGGGGGGVGTASALVLPTATASPLPIVHYNPIYVQAPPEQQQQHQQQQQQQHQFAILPRFSNNNPKAAYNLAHESTPPIHVVRLSAANALGGQPQQQQQQQSAQSIHHYHHYQPVQQQQQQQQQHFYQSNYPEEQAQQQQQPGIIPYFSHPGAVHYGTHLYHPATAATASTASATSTKQQEQQLQLQLQQQQQQLRQAAGEATATSGSLPGDNGAAENGVKQQPTAAANIVQYP